MATASGRVSDAWSVYTDIPSAPGASFPAASSGSSDFWGDLVGGVTGFFSGLADTGLSIWDRVTTTQIAQQQAQANADLTSAQAANLGGGGGRDMTPLLLAGGLALAAVVILKK